MIKYNMKPLHGADISKAPFPFNDATAVRQPQLSCTRAVMAAEVMLDASVDAINRRHHMPLVSNPDRTFILYILDDHLFYEP